MFLKSTQLLLYPLLALSFLLTVGCSDWNKIINGMQTGTTSPRIGFDPIARGPKHPIQIQKDGSVKCLKEELVGYLAPRKNWTCIARKEAERLKEVFCELCSPPEERLCLEVGGCYVLTEGTAPIFIKNRESLFFSSGKGAIVFPTSVGAITSVVRVVRHNCSRSNDLRVGYYPNLNNLRKSDYIGCIAKKEAESLEANLKNCFKELKKGCSRFKEMLCLRENGCSVFGITKGYEKKPILLKKGERILSATQETIVFPSLRYR